MIWTLPWKDPSFFLAEESDVQGSQASVDHNLFFRDFLASSKVIRQQKKDAQARVVQLNRLERLRGEEVRAYSHAIREITVINSLISRSNRAPIKDLELWEDYIYLLTSDNTSWYFSLTKACYRFNCPLTQILNPSTYGRIGNLWNLYLESYLHQTTERFDRQDLEILFSEEGQSPFLISALPLLADPNINVTILVLGPDRFDSKFLEALRKVITTGAPGARFMVSPLRKQGRNTRAKKTGPQPARLLTWRFDHSFLKSGTQLRVFKKQLMNLSRGTIRPFLQVHLAMDSFPRQQQAIFAVMDTVLEIQNNISGFDLRIHVGSLIGPDGRELNWETQQMRIANVEDVIKTLLWAEFDNRALVPKRARRCSDDVYASGVSLRARQPTEVESCFPLDEISTLEPPLSRHHLRFGRDFQDMIIDEFEAEKRPHKFLFFGNGPFVVGSTPRHATARSILRTFQRWRPLKSYLKVFRNSEDQKKMLSVLDLLVRNEILEVRRPLQRRRKISAPSKHGCIHFVGVGPGEEGAMSIGAAAALDGAEEIWMQDLGPPGFERAFLRRWIYNAPKVVNLSSFYDIAEASRSLFYNITPRRILHLAQQGRSITFAFSGNPEVWVYLTEVVKQHTLHQRVALKLTHSMSFIDIMYEATPLSFPDKVQVRLGGVTAPDISPNMDCILGQLGDRGKTGFHSATKQLVEDLQRFFPDDHPIFLSGNHAISGTQKSLQISVKELAAVALKFNQWNFSALIPSLSRGRLVQKLFAEGNPDNSMVFF